jgi:hypothetical protein
MVRISRAVLALLLVLGLGAGCRTCGANPRSTILNPKHLVADHVCRLLYEAHQLHMDIDRVIFGIDYPGGEPESAREIYYGIPEPGQQPPID